MKAIKDVTDEAWREFKIIAVREQTTMAELFEKMVEHYKQKSRASWQNILHRKGTLSDKDVRIMLDTVKTMRTEKGFRE